MNSSHIQLDESIRFSSEKSFLHLSRLHHFLQRTKCGNKPCTGFIRFFYIFNSFFFFFKFPLKKSGIGVPIRNDSRSEVIVSQLTSSASYRRSIDSPFVTVGAVITAHDFNTEMSKALRFYAPGSDRRHHGGSEKKLFEEFGLQRSLSDSDINLIVSSWNFLKKRLSSFAPKLLIG